jgi:DNA-3-methyladenine glycosylase
MGCHPRDPRQSSVGMKMTRRSERNRAGSPPPGAKNAHADIDFGAASHGFGVPSLRNASLFGPPGRAYVYRSYGIHWCLNFVCREADHAAGVLIRSIEPTAGIPLMMRRRASSDLRLLSSGPGRLGQALGVSDALNGKRLDRAPFTLLGRSRTPSIVRGERIGISKEIDRPWRFGLKGSVFVSRRFT